MIEFLILIATLISTPLEDSMHKFHVSYGRVAVEGNVMAARIRFFKDDLQDALVAHGGDNTFEVGPTADSDSLLMDYLTHHLVMKTDGQVAVPRLNARGDDMMDNEPMWWVLLEYDAEEDITELHITNDVLMETFDDQKNIMRVQHFPSNDSWTLYFVEDDRDYGISFDG